MKKKTFDKIILNIWSKANYFLSEVEGSLRGIVTLWNPSKLKGSLGFSRKKCLMVYFEDLTTSEN